VLQERLREEWRTRERAVPVYPVMTFAADGLVLGAGTVLLRAEGPGKLQDLRGQEARSLHCWLRPMGRQWHLPSWATLDAR
jgi:hypothetical protein